MPLHYLPVPKPPDPRGPPQPPPTPHPPHTPELYVAGLIGPGDRKSVQPMAKRLAPGDYSKLASFCFGWRLERGASGDGAAHSSGSARWWQ